MATFVVADWHLGDTRFQVNGIIYRPFDNLSDMHKTLIENHNRLVKEDDVVFVLGDVCVDGNYINLVKEFNGIKTLVRGNHDRKFTDDQLLPYFNKIYSEGDGLDYEEYYLTHYPTCGKADKFNIVGHVHSAWRFQLNMINVGVDVSCLHPTNIEVIPNMIYKINNYLDDDIFASYLDLNKKFIGSRGVSGSYFKKEVK